MLLEQREKGTVSIRGIALQLAMARNTVRKYAKQWDVYGDSERLDHAHGKPTASPAMQMHLETMVEALKSP